MQMSGKTSKQLAEETIAYAGQMSPMTRNDFIDLISDPFNTSPAMYFLFKKYLNFAFLFTMLMFCCT